MYRSIVKLFGFGSAASSSRRPDRTNRRPGFRPAFDHLEAREVPAASTLRSTLASSVGAQVGAIGQQAPTFPGANGCPAGENCFDVSDPKIPPVAPQPGAVLAEVKLPTGDCPIGQNCFTV